MVKEYHFGSITIDGKTYNHDVEVRWTPPTHHPPARGGPLEVLKWWRKESHVIDVDDVKRAVKENPETIIIGNGESGVARVTKEAQRFIKEKGIKLIIDKTEKAVKTFNVILGEGFSSPPPPPQGGGEGEKWRRMEESELEEGRQNKVIGLFHLTC